MDKQLTKRGTMSAKYNSNKRIILDSTFTSEDAYSILQFNTAIEWIRYNVLNDEDVVNRILAHPDFKNWWLNQWNIREDAFIHDQLDYILSNLDFASYLKAEWLKVHQYDRIRVKPSSIIEAVLKSVADKLAKEVKHGS